jgi:hypothetical protein
MNIKKFLPYIAAVVAFLLITIIYFKPLLSGKEISQHDIMQARGMSKEIADFREKEKTEPLWTNSMFGGMPAYQVSTLYPGNWMKAINDALILFLPLPSGYIFLCFLGFFILLLCLDTNPWLALVGGIAYGLSTYFLVALGAGHNSKINALAYLPPVIGGVVLLFSGKLWLGTAVTSLFLALELTANHVQITYYGFMIIGAILIGYLYYAVKEKTLPQFFKAFAFFAVAAIVAILPNAGNLMCTNEYGKYSTRGKTELTITPDGKSNSDVVTSGLDKDYVVQYSHGIGESFTFLIPEYKGGASTSAIGENYPDALKKVSPDFREQIANARPYFGPQGYTAGPIYIGAIIIFLVILGLFITKHKLKWPLVIITILGMALSWGQNFMGLTSFFLDHVPGYNKFRAVSMIMVIAEFCLPLLAVLAVNELIHFKSWNEKIKLVFSKKELELKKVLIIAFAITGGFCLLGYLMPDLVNDFRMPGEEEQLVQAFNQRGEYPDAQVRQYVMQYLPQLEIARKAIFKSDAMRSFIFITLAAIFIYLYLDKKLKREMLFAALGIFILIDLYTVDLRYLGERNYVPKAQNVASFDKSPADEQILKDPDPNYRVLNLAASPFSDAVTSYWHKSIGGYHGAKLKKYQELYDFHFNKQINTFYQGFSTARGNDSIMNEEFKKLSIFNMLNTKYFIVQFGENKVAPVINPQANGNAWFVKEVTVVENADKEITVLGGLDTKEQAVMQAKFRNDIKVEGSYSAEGNIKLLSYKPNELVYESDSKAQQFAVFSEIYYPKGWNAYVDGNLQPHAAVNYILRGMPVPAGKHKIEFKFEPQTYYTANKIATAGSILVLLSVGFGVWMEFKKGKKTETA